MRYTYAYKTSDGVRHEAMTDAPSREAVFETLRAQGIKAIKVVAADGSKANGEMRGVRRRVVMALVMVVALGVGIVAYRGGTRSVASAASGGGGRGATALPFLTDQTRRQVIGDAAIIEKGIRTGWAEVFEHEGDRFLASFAIPGVKAGVRNTSVEALEECLKIEKAGGESRSTKELSSSSNAPSTKHQAPSTKHQAPSPKPQAPSTNHQSPITKHQAPSTRHQAPSTKHQAPGTKHQAPGTNHQSPSTNHQAPSTKHQAPSTNHQAPGTKPPAPGTNHQSPSTNHQAPSTKHQASGTSLEAQQIIAMVEGMKREARAYIAAGGTVIEYGKRLVERQDAEIALYKRIEAEILAAQKTLPEKEFSDFLDTRNDELRNLGIKPITLSESN